MSDAWFYFKYGWEHIISFDALDHQLFIVALTIWFTLKQWKKVLILITAFTIGHSITLVLSTLNILTLPNKLIEFLIPCTIIITALSNILKRGTEHKAIHINYYFALFFGLVHGLGFANILKFMLAKDQSLGWSLFLFNLGLEVGQILVVMLILVLIYLLLNYLKFNRRYLIIIASAIVLAIAIKMALERIPFTN
jgi:hydrogenase/urease accessory protein HupE